MRGVASFRSDQLQYIWWTQGAPTDKDVGIGSTLVQLRQACGPDLLQGGSYNDFYVVAQSSAPPVIAIHFLLNTRGYATRVYDVVWGAYGAIKSSGAISSEAPFRVNC
jgi:hypothetical protein